MIVRRVSNPAAVEFASHRHDHTCEVEKMLFDIGAPELVVIAAVAIVVIGPKDLPRVMRLVGQWTGKAKRMAGDFQNQFNQAIREAELHEIKDQVEAIGTIDPIAELAKDSSAAKDSIVTEIEKPAAPTEDPTSPNAD